MTSLNILQTYFFYLVHPFKTHRLLKRGETEAGRSYPIALGVYESLATSWIFIVISAMLRIILLNVLIIFFIKTFNPFSGVIENYYDGDRFIAFYFIILTTFLDVIFFPLITLFVVQFWEFVLKGFAKLAGVEGNVEEKVRAILAVALSSHILQIVPVLGDVAQKFAHFVQMYGGIREQLGFSRSLTLCALFTPVLIFMMFFSLIFVLFSI